MNGANRPETDKNIRPQSMERRYLQGFVLVALFAILVAFLTTTALFQMAYTEQVDRMLRQYGEVVAAACAEREGALGLETDLPAAIRQNITGDPRVTLVAMDGTVLYDNQVDDVSAMENHRDRPEIAAALASAPTVVVRQSETLGHETHYYALMIIANEQPVGLLRVSEEVNNIWGITFRTLPMLGLAALVILAVASVISWALTKRLVRPITHMAQHLDDIEAVVPYEELIPLAHTVQTDRKLREDNEQIRREFTANVSHELKTPLTSISGYAELMENGMAKPEDVQVFAGRIHKEAQRMISLVSDILQLSELDSTAGIKLDDGAALPAMTPIDLAALVKEISQTMTVNARKAYVTLQYSAQPAVVLGQRDLLTELATNLCDNAIRYNCPGGHVNLSCGTGPDGRPWLKVEDNGIGIPQDSQARVFERFYRVDKSRSKATGGTGLGLAIVKHIAMLLGAKIELKSQVGTGTLVTVIFPQGKLP